MKRWQKYVSVYLLMTCGFLANAQQVPLINQYFRIPTLAYASSSSFERRPVLSMFYRGQWSNLVGAPETLAINYTNPLDRTISYNINLSSFKLGVLNQNHFSAGISRAFIAGGHYFSLGAELGGSLFSLNDDRISVETISDQLLQQLIGNTGIGVFVNPSVSYRYGTFSMNFAMPGLIRESISNDSYARLNSDNQADYLLNFAYAMALDSKEKIIFTPSVTWRNQVLLGSQFDVMASLDFDQKFQVTGGYRDEFGSTIGVGVRVKENIHFTYNYEFGKKGVPFISDGFSEIALHFSFKNQEEKSRELEKEALEIVKVLQGRGIYNPDLIGNADREILMKYLFSIQGGNKKQRGELAEQAFGILLQRIEQNGRKRLAAEAIQRKATADSLIRVQEELALQAAEEERKRLLDIELQALKEREAIELKRDERINRALSLATESISFNSGSAILEPSSFSSLEAVVELLNIHPEIRLKLMGFTDDSGDVMENLNLSQKRAEAVRNYMISSGISSDRLFSEGFGNAYPRASNNTPAGRKLNRRVEMKIIK